MAVSVPKLEVGDVVEFKYTASQEGKEPITCTFSGRVLTVETMHNGGYCQVGFEGTYLTINKRNGEWSIHSGGMNTYVTKIVDFKKR